MRRITTYTVAAALALTAQMAYTDDWAANLSAFAPNDAEIVAYVNLRGFVTHDVYDEIRATQDMPQLDAKMKALEDSLGVNPIRDISAFAVVGQLGPEGDRALILEGAWPEERLIDAVSMSARYGVEDYGGEVVHGWEDYDTGEMKYASFLRNRILAVSSTPDMLAQVIDCASSPAVTSTLPPIPAPVDGTPLALVLLRPTAGHIGSNPLAGKVTGVSLALSAGDGTVTLAIEAEAKTADDAALLAEALQGAAAFAQLQLGMADQGLWPVRTAAHGTRISGSLTLPTDRAMAVVAAVRGRKQQGPR